jgi:hypothetical protein
MDDAAERVPMFRGRNKISRQRKRERETDRQREGDGDLFG